VVVAQQLIQQTQRLQIGIHLFHCILLLIGIHEHQLSGIGLGRK